MKVIINGVEYAPVAALQTHIQGEFVTGTAQAKQAKPKPLLSDAKVGDLARNKFGWFQIADTEFDKRFPIYSEKCGCFTLNGKASEAQDCGIDILEWQPLATEGSAEWAWQMQLLGKKVNTHNNISINGTFSNWYYSMDTPNVSSLHGIPECLNLCSKNKWRESMAKTGWQLYEPAKQVPANGYYAVTTVDPIPIILEMHDGKWLYPDGTLREFESVADIVSYVPAEKPEPPFAKVQAGDWVEINEGGSMFQCEVNAVETHNNAIYLEGYSGFFRLDTGISTWNKFVFITRKLDPSDVRVKISLEGTVAADEQASKNELGFWLNDTHWICYNELDPATADLVRELIAKQGGEMTKHTHRYELRYVDRKTQTTWEDAIDIDNRESQDAEIYAKRNLRMSFALMIFQSLVSNGIIEEVTND